MLLKAVLAALLFQMSGSYNTWPIFNSTVSEYGLLVTFHGGPKKGSVNNIYMYSPQGDLMSSNVLNNIKETSVAGLRTLFYAPEYESIIFANSITEDSRLMALNISGTSEFACTGSGPAQYFLMDSSLKHPYGITSSPVGHGFLVSNQGDPSNPPQTIMHYTIHDNKYNASVFANVSNPRDILTMEISGAFFVFVCDKTSDSVIKYDSSGKILERFVLKAKNPIALKSYHDPSTNDPWLLVASNDAARPAIYAFDAYTGGSPMLYKGRFVHPRLRHPCGMDTLGDTLYALSQASRQLFTFSIGTASFLGIIVATLPDFPEDLKIVHLPTCAPKFVFSSRSPENMEAKTKKKKGKAKKEKNKG